MRLFICGTANGNADSLKFLVTGQISFKAWKWSLEEAQKTSFL